MTARALADHHRRILEEGSAISPDVIAERPYWTASTWQDLPPGVFKPNQKKPASFPALIIEQHDPSGQSTYPVIRYDVPPVKKNGQTMKYVQPAGVGLRLDVPLRCVDGLHDLARPLWWGEGAKKADCLASHGVIAVSTPGVEGWRSPSAIADLYGIPLNQREVIISYDSDVLSKPSVFMAVQSIAKWLRQKHADVYVVDWSQAGLPDGSKAGVDDYLASGHSIEDVEAMLVSLDEWIASMNQPDGNGLYVVDHGHIAWRKRERDGDVLIPLANFDARIVEQIVVDDGAEERGELVIEGTRDDGRPLGRQHVALTQFNGMSWCVAIWGAGAIVAAGSSAKDRLREGIQVLSGDVPIHRTYAHTGWRQIDGEWRFLSTGSAIGKDGAVHHLDVSLPESLAYTLPDPPSGDVLRHAVRVSLSVLDVAPIEVTAPTYGATYLAPLREALGSEAPDLVVWSHGPSGAFKSEEASLLMCHFGFFPRTRLPANFSATANALERLTHTAKDVLLVADDFHPASDVREAQAMAQAANRLLRGAGNQSGRPRMKADTTLRAELRPRCITLVTGERLPDGHSTAARMFPVAVAPGAIRKDRLSALQGQVDRLPYAMAGYVQYIAQRMDELRKRLPERFRELRGKANNTGHARGPAQIAHLFLGLEMATEYAVSVGALAEAERAELLAKCWAALVALDRERAVELSNDTPVARFLDLLRDGFTSRQAYVETENSSHPDDAQSWGWKLVTSFDQDGNQNMQWYPGHGATLLGTITDDWLLLAPETTYQWVTGRERAANRAFPVEMRTLLRRLDEEGLIATSGDGRRTVTVRMGVEQKPRRVIKIRRTAFESARPESVTPNGADVTPTEGLQVTENEPAQARNEGPVPPVTDVTPNSQQEAPGFAKQEKQRVAPPPSWPCPICEKKAWRNVGPNEYICGACYDDEKYHNSKS